VVNQKEIDQAKGEVAKLFEVKFAQKGGFAKQIRKAKRHLSRNALINADIIVQAEKDLKHPRLRRRVDKTKVTRAKRDLIHAADRINPAAQRSRFWFQWGSGLLIKISLGMVGIFVMAQWFGGR
tara:strand:+ start:15526 stop:15897 length:372 start_codon:yes stop_codon:yes gene_type:complete